MNNSQTVTGNDSSEDVTQNQDLKLSSEFAGSTLEDKLSKVSVASGSCQELSACCDRKENREGLTRCGEMLFL